MTDQTTTTVLTISAVQHNYHGEFGFSEDVSDPISGEYKPVAKITHLAPGMVYDLPAPLANELIEVGAARLLTAQESQLHALEAGTTIVDRVPAPAGFYEGVES